MPQGHRRHQSHRHHSRCRHQRDRRRHHRHGRRERKLIWSPRCPNISLYGDTAPVTEYKEAGVPIGMGTDWLAMSGSMNSAARALVRRFDLNQKNILNQDIQRSRFALPVEMATKNGALAIGFDSQIGTLAAGLVGDIAIYAAGTNKDYRAVIAAGVEDVMLVLRGGKPLYGRQTIIDVRWAADAKRSPFADSNKTVCIDTPNVKLVPDVQTAATSFVSALFLAKTRDAWDGEPTCVPYRDAYPNGTSATDAVTWRRRR